MKNTQLTTLRKQINKIDDTIINLLAERITVVKKIGEEKTKLQMQPLDKNRWRQVQKLWRKRAKNCNLSEEFAEKIYNIIHENAVTLQKEKK